MMTKEHAHIDTWLIDMDGTIYDQEKYVIPKLWETFTSYVETYIPEQAGNIRSFFLDYVKQYGTFIQGLIKHHPDIDPDHFQQHIHNFDVSPIKRCALTTDGIARLPGQKIIFTNSARDFTERVLDHHGLMPHLDGIVTIEDVGYTNPKPHMKAYERCLEKFGLDPRRTGMIEDTHGNLVAARQLGMHTVWLHGDKKFKDHLHVREAAHNMAQWLQRVLPPPAPVIPPAYGLRL